MRRFVLQLGLLCIVALTAGQEIDFNNVPVMDYSRSREYGIADITVSGVEFLQKEVLISLSGLYVGKIITVPGNDITDVVEKFWSQGLFADVKISATKIEEGKIWLDIYLKERPRLAKLTVHGLKKGETTDLTEKLNIRNGSQVTDDLLNDIRRIIREHFIDKGFMNTDIRIVQKDDSVRVNMVTLDVYVDKNARVKIEEFFISGNEAFTAKRLRRVMKDTKKRNLPQK